VATAVIRFRARSICNPEKFGEAAFYGWSEDKTRQAAQPEGAAFPPWLRRHGFTFD
jgi:hypothetical protein